MSADIHLSSGRLVYKPIHSGHNSQEYLEWLNDASVTRYLEIFEPYTNEQLNNYLVKAEKDPALLFWGIHIKENDKHIGNIKVDPVNRRHGYGEFGIMMGDKSEWGKGYALEASQRIIDFCFAELGLRKIVLGVVAENAAALKLYKKLGFETEGVFKSHGLYDGEYCDLLRMALFKPGVKR